MSEKLCSIKKVGGVGNGKELIQLTPFTTIRTATTLNVGNYVKDYTSLTIDDFLFVTPTISCKGTAWVATYNASYDSSMGILTYRNSGGLVDAIDVAVYIYAEPVSSGSSKVIFQYPSSNGYYIDGSTQHVLEHDTNLIFLANWNNSGTGAITCNGVALSSLANVINLKANHTNSGYGCYSAEYEYAFKAGDVIEIPNSHYYAEVILIY